MTQGKYQYLYEGLEEKTLYTHRTLVYQHTWKDSRSKQLALKAANQNALKFKRLQILPDGQIDGVDAWSGAHWYQANHQWLNREKQNNRPTSELAVPLPPLKRRGWPFNKLISVALTIGLALVGGFVLSSFQTGKVDRLVKASDVQGLRDMLRDPSHLELQTQIREGIAAIRERDGFEVFSHIEEVRAVFAFKQDPMVLIGDKVIQIGDHVTIDMVTGWVSEINSNRLVIKGSEGHQTVWLPRMNLLGYPFNRNFPVTLYQHPGNSLPILEAVALMTRREVEGQMDACMVGHVEAEDYDAFLAEVAPHLSIFVDNEAISVLPTRQVRGYIGWTRYYKMPNIDRMSKILGDMAELLGYEVALEGEDEVIMVPNRQMQEICEDLALDIAVNNRERYIEVHSEHGSTE